MRNGILVLALSLFFVHLSSAQEYPDAGFKKFGFTAGVNFSHMNFNKGVPPPPSPVKTNWKGGIFFGFLLHVPLTSQWSVQPEYIFSQQGGAPEGSGINYKLNYISMPVLLRYQINGKVAVLAGPQLDMLINAKKDSSGKSYNITHDTEERNFGLTAGIEYAVLKNLGIYVRYMLGINHVGIGQRSELKEFKFELLKGGANIRF
jgi:hypothetical protein